MSLAMRRLASGLRQMCVAQRRALGSTAGTVTPYNATSPLHRLPALISVASDVSTVEDLAALLSRYNAGLDGGAPPSLPSTRAVLQACRRVGDVGAALGVVHDALVSGVRGHRELGCTVASMCSTVDQMYEVYVMLQSVFDAPALALEESLPDLLALCVDSDNERVGQDVVRRLVASGQLEPVLAALVDLTVRPSSSSSVFRYSPGILAAVCPRKDTDPSSSSSSSCCLVTAIESTVPGVLSGSPDAVAAVANACACCETHPDSSVLPGSDTTGSVVSRVKGVLGQSSPSPVTPEGLLAEARAWAWECVVAAGNDSPLPIEALVRTVCDAAAGGAVIRPAFAATVTVLCATSKRRDLAVSALTAVRASRPWVSSLEAAAWVSPSFVSTAQDGVEVVQLMQPVVVDADPDFMPPAFPVGDPKSKAAQLLESGMVTGLQRLLPGTKAAALSSALALPSAATLSAVYDMQPSDAALWVAAVDGRHPVATHHAEWRLVAEAMVDPSTASSALTTVLKRIHEASSSSPPPPLLLDMLLCVCAASPHTDLHHRAVDAVSAAFDHASSIGVSAAIRCAARVGRGQDAVSWLDRMDGSPAMTELLAVATHAVVSEASTPSSSTSPSSS